MKKINLIWIFGVLFLGILAFFLGTSYGKTNSSITGNVVYDNIDQERLDLLENDLNSSNEEFQLLKRNENETGIKDDEIIVGGGWVNGDFHGVEDGIGKDCWSWGDATCIISSSYASNKVELICPEKYTKISTGIYTSNPLSSEDIDVVFVCVINTFAKKQSHLVASQNTE